MAVFCRVSCSSCRLDVSFGISFSSLSEMQMLTFLRMAIKFFRLACFLSRDANN